MLRGRFRRKECRPRGPLGVSRLIASRMVFRHRARARHRGQGKRDQRAKSATRRLTHLKKPTPTRRLPTPTRCLAIPTHHFHGATGLFVGATRPFSKRRLGPTHGRLDAPGATCGTDSAPGAATRSVEWTRGGRLASPTRLLPFGEATSPRATRPRDSRPPWPTRPRATTVCPATSSAVSF